MTIAPLDAAEAQTAGSKESGKNSAKSTEKKGKAKPEAKKPADDSAAKPSVKFVNEPPAPREVEDGPKKASASEAKPEKSKSPKSGKSKSGDASKAAPKAAKSAEPKSEPKASSAADAASKPEEKAEKPGDSTKPTDKPADPAAADKPAATAPPVTDPAADKNVPVEAVKPPLPEPLPAPGEPLSGPSPLQPYEPLPDSVLGLPTPFGNVLIPAYKAVEYKPAEQMTYTVGKIVVKYGTDVRKRNPKLPTEEALAAVGVNLTEANGVFYHIPQLQSLDARKTLPDPAFPTKLHTPASNKITAEKKKGAKPEPVTPPPVDPKQKPGAQKDVAAAKSEVAKPGAKPGAKPAETKGNAALQVVSFVPAEGSKPRTVSAAALIDIFDGIVKSLNDRGLIGVYIMTNLDPRGGDREWKAGADVEVQVFVSEVLKNRTIMRRVPFKMGDVSLINDEDAPDGVAVKDKKHLWIKDKSPVKPGSIVEKSVLQDYLRRLNRFVGRRVDAAMNASGQPGKVIMDYLIKEQKPLFIYAQSSNTGTEATGVWRHRLGFEYKQLANIDDILRVEYVTSDPSLFQSAFASYDFALNKPDYLKGRIYASYGMYSAEDIGFGLQTFEGENLTLGGAVTWTPLYIKEFPLDLSMGAEMFNVKVDNQDFGEAKGSFILPFLSIGTDRRTDVFSFAANIEMQASFGGPSQEDLDGLGRIDTEGEFFIGKWDVSMSAYLEPIFLGKKWRDYGIRETATKKDVEEYEKLGGKKVMGVDQRVYFDIKQKAEQKWKRGVRAHELAFASRGQYVLDDARLSPQLEFLAGGFNTVRGYPESFTAGDSGWQATAEYRLHIPRLFAPYEVLDARKDLAMLLSRKPPQPEPKTKGKGRKGKTEPVPQTPPPKLLSTDENNRSFNFRAPRAGVEPDWDLIFRVFGDAAQTKNNRLQVATEVDRSLLSVGAGLELQIFKPLHMTFRLDYGMVLADETELLLEPVFSGDSRIHLSGTIAW